MKRRVTFHTGEFAKIVGVNKRTLHYYDEQGNWTQAYVYHVTPSEGYIYQVITRQITYYED